MSFKFKSNIGEQFQSLLFEADFGAKMTRRCGEVHIPFLIITVQDYITEGMIEMNTSLAVFVTEL